MRRSLGVLVALLLSVCPAFAQQTITIDWQAGVDGGPPTGYLVQVGAAPGATNSQANVGLVTTTSLTLNPGSWYIRVLAYNGAGQSPPSNEVPWTVGTPTGAR